MKEPSSSSFDDLSDDVLSKEAPTDFFGTAEQTANLNLLAQYVRENRFRPIFVTGPAGYGKTTLVRQYVARSRSANTEVEWVNLGNNPDPLQAIEATILRLQEARTRNRLLVVLDGAEGLISSAQLERTLNRIFNWKIVRNVIVTTRDTEIRIRGARQINVGPPEGKLYGLRDQLVTPQKKIISVVAPHIVAANDVLIEQLKQKPEDLYKITSRQFEEVIADLLTGMGFDVELTPETRDGGKDILAYMETPIGKVLTLVEAKQYNKNRPVGVSLVRSLFGTLVDHQATSGLLVTTSRFAKPAKQFQERHKYQLELKEYGDVVSWLMKHKS
jgi:restriction system protein